MKKQHNKIDRRNFLKTVGAVGVGSVLSSVISEAGPNEPNVNDPNAPAKAQEPAFPQVPRRKLGKTGIDVPILSFGGMFNLMNSQIVLRRTLKLGVNYWDTASIYAGGNSELGIGEYLSKNPQARKKVFLVTKASYAKSINDVENLLQTSLKRMNTDYIDLYYGVHGLEDPVLLNDELKNWSQNAKKRKLIRFFGFSTHKNMSQCLTSASKLDWIDVIMTSYNFRLMQDAALQTAIDACRKAGIGLVAMKIQAHGSVAAWAGQATELETEQDKKVVSHFLEKGFTEGQAKIKAVLADERFGSACVTMQNVALLTSNVAAVLDKTQLTRKDMHTFIEYAQATCSGYCAGCAHICDSALPDVPYVSDIMRYLMYYNSYGEKELAGKLFAGIPGEVRGRLRTTDYSLAEARCPQRLPIGKLVAEAVSKLA